jgi:glycerol kinase
LCQFQADILGIDIVRPKAVETTSLGAAYLAGLAVGYWKDSDEIKKCWSVDKVFKSSMDKKTASRFYEGWRRAVDRTLA